MPKKNPKLFIDPKAHYPVGNEQLSFTDYIAQCKKLISSTRLDLNQQNREKIIEANAPFELRPAGETKPRSGALLIHGLLDSPFQMQDIGRHLQSKGCLVRCILMPGHGTVPGALLHVDYHEWLQTLQYGFYTLAKEVDEIFLVGHSTGAALSFYHALLDPHKVKGIILLAPAFKINSIFAPLSYLPPQTRWPWLRSDWFQKDPQETIDYVKYSSLPYNAIFQVYRLTADIKSFLPTKQLTCPLFFALSEDDDIICPRTVIRYFEKHPHPKSRLILYTKKPNPARDDNRIILRDSVYPAEHVRDFSHICVPIAPSNPHYGKNGDYPYASHVDQAAHTVFGEFSKLQLKINAILYRYHLAAAQYERLTFNPDYEFLTQAIDRFLS